jgi:hypothetical protein
MKFFKKSFLDEEIERTEAVMKVMAPDSDDYKEALETYERLREQKKGPDVGKYIVEAAKVAIPVGASIFLGLLAYKKNQEMELKDGDVWSESKKLR